MDDVPGQEVDVVVTKRNPGVADPLPVEQVQLAVIHPDGALKDKQIILDDNDSITHDGVPYPQRSSQRSK